MTSAVCVSYKRRRLAGSATRRLLHPDFLLFNAVSFSGDESVTLVGAAPIATQDTWGSHDETNIAQQEGGSRRKTQTHTVIIMIIMIAVMKVDINIKPDRSD